jgi:hypothetical protein
LEHGVVCGLHGEVKEVAEASLTLCDKGDERAVIQYAGLKRPNAKPPLSAHVHESLQEFYKIKSLRGLTIEREMTPREHNLFVPLRKECLSTRENAFGGF